MRRFVVYIKTISKPPEVIRLGQRLKAACLSCKLTLRMGRNIRSTVLQQVWYHKHPSEFKGHVLQPFTSNGGVSIQMNYCRVGG